MKSVSIVDLEIHAEKFDEFLELINQHAVNCLAIEEACLSFDVLVPKHIENHVWLYEVYTNAETHQQHRETPHMKAFIEKAGPMIKDKCLTESNLLDKAA